MSITAAPPTAAKLDLVGAALPLDDAHVSSRAADEAVSGYQQARISGLKASLAILALAAIGALFFTRRIPITQPKGGP